MKQKLFKICWLSKVTFRRDCNPDNLLPEAEAKELADKANSNHIFKNAVHTIEPASVYEINNFNERQKIIREANLNPADIAQAIYQ